MNDLMRKAVVVCFGLMLAGLAIFASLATVQASPDYQPTPFLTATPGPDGRILYTVQEGDSAYRIAAVAGITLDEFLQLNNFGPDPVLQIGQVVLIGLVEPPAPTLAPGETRQPEEIIAALTPTALLDASTICAQLYLDENGDALRQETEIALADGEVSVTERLGVFSGKQTTTFNDTPVCFENIPPGSYIITMAIPTGFNRTTDLSLTIELAPGDTSYVNFGAQPSGDFAADLNQELPNNPNSPILGLAGVLFLLVGAGAAVYAAMRGRRKYPEDKEPQGGG